LAIQDDYAPMSDGREDSPAGDPAWEKPGTQVIAPVDDPYLGFERRLRAPLQRVGDHVMEPLIGLLARLGVSPHAMSGFQVLLSVGVFYTLPRWPRGSLFLWLAALASDGVDGMLARRLGRASSFGMLWDQVCDHAREVLVVAALAYYGVVPPLWPLLYASTYPAFNLLIFLGNRFATPLALAVKMYLVLYPALIAYLGWGINVLNPALALATMAMVASGGTVLWRLYGAMQ